MTTRDDQPAPIDPAVESAPPEGWRRWASDLGHYQKERIAGFGGILIAGFLLGVITLYIFAWLADEVVSRETTALDGAAFLYIHQFASPQMDIIMRALSFMGSEGVLIIGAILLVVFLWQRRWGAAVILVLVTAGAQVLNDILKTVFHRSRPEPIVGVIAAQQWSFPSGHAMVAAAFYFYIAYICWRLIHGVWRIMLIVVLTLLVLLIGISRIYLQAHYLSDVIAGYLAGFFWTDAVIIGSQVLVTRGSSRRPGQPPQTTESGQEPPESGVVMRQRIP